MSDHESHIEDSQKLDADAYVTLFQITLNDGATTLYYKASKSGTWQGQTYIGTGISLSGAGSSAESEVYRPTLNLFNPNGVHNESLINGLFENATVVRIRVLKEHFTANTAIYRSNKWKIARVSSVKRPFITFELRTPSDGALVQIPARMFMPPDFPSVSLK